MMTRTYDDAPTPEAAAALAEALALHFAEDLGAGAVNPADEHNVVSDTFLVLLREACSVAGVQLAIVPHEPGTMVLADIIPAADPDAELGAARRCVNALQSLSAGPAGRVAAYLVARFPEAPFG